MAWDKDLLQRAVERSSTPVHIRSKAEYISHFQDKYGAKDWKREAASFIAGTRDTKSREYKSAIRNFQGSRLNQEGKTNKWEAIGKQLPPLSRKNNGDVVVTIKGKQGKGPRGGERDRTISVTLSGSQAYDFVNDPSWDVIWEEYGYEPDEDGDYAFSIYSVS